jgi:hypothetical protein
MVDVGGLFTGREGSVDKELLCLQEAPAQSQLHLLETKNLQLQLCLTDVAAHEQLTHGFMWVLLRSLCWLIN